MVGEHPLIIRLTLRKRYDTIDMNGSVETASVEIM